MLSRVRWPPYAWIWSAGILTCLLGASGVAVMVRPTTPAIAGSASEEPPSGDVSSAIMQSPLRIAKTAASRGNCTECGTIASIREIASAADAARQELGEARRDHSLAVASPTRSTAATDAEARRYEITIRFRDGRTRVFTERGTPTWRVGSRIVSIDGAAPRAN